LERGQSEARQGADRRPSDDEGGSRRVQGARSEAERTVLVREPAEGVRRDDRTRVQGEQGCVGLFQRAAARLSQAVRVLRHGGEEGRDARAPSRAAHEGVVGREADPMSVTGQTFRIERATERDVPLILSLIKSLAEYERMSSEVVATEAGLRETLFGPRPSAE